jgi:dihydrofolate reductase
MQIIIIAALADNYVIGSNNQLPWHLPSDLKHFRDLTLGKPIVMGRKTYESIGKALPGRRNIVLSKNKDLIAIGCEVYSSLEQALVMVKSCPEVFIIGGTAIYEQVLPLADKMYLTLVHGDFIGDIYFPKWNTKSWRILERQDFQPDQNHAYAYSFVVLKRVMSTELD